MAFYAACLRETMIFKVPAPPYSIIFASFSGFHPRDHFYSFLVKKRRKRSCECVRVFASVCEYGGGPSKQVQGYEDTSHWGNAFQHQFTPAVPEGMADIFNKVFEKEA